MQIRFYATLRKIVGQKTVEFSLPENPTLQDVLDEVLKTYPSLSENLLDESGQLSSHVHLFVNGRSSKYLIDGMLTRVDIDQKVEFFPAVAGG